MRLTTINSGIDDNFISSLYILLNGSTNNTISENIIRIKYDKLNKPSIPYLFIKSAINYNILSESETSNLEAILRTGVSKLKAALTPGTASDLDMLMSFMAPNTGGSKAVDELIEAAKTEVPLSQNEDWWTNLFSTLNINDISVQQDIQRQALSEVGQKAPIANKPQAQQQARQAQQQARDALDQSTYADELNQERAAAVQWRDQLSDTITKGRERQKLASDKLSQLNNRLDELLRQKAAEESIKRIGRTLLEFDSIKSNLKPITNNAIRLINRQYGYNIPTISEAGLLDKLRTMMANPGYAKNQLNNTNIVANNTQAAKLAIRIATDHLRNKFKKQLQAAKITPQEIINSYKDWLGGQATPEQEESLRKAHELFNMKPDGSSSELSSEDASDPLNADQEYVANLENVSEQVVTAMANAAKQAVSNQPDKQHGIMLAKEAAKNEAVKAIKNGTVNKQTAAELLKLVNNWIDLSAKKALEQSRENNKRISNMPRLPEEPPQPPSKQSQSKPKIRRPIIFVSSENKEQLKFMRDVWSKYRPNVLILDTMNPQNREAADRLGIHNYTGVVFPDGSNAINIFDDEDEIGEALEEYFMTFNQN